MERAGDDGGGQGCALYGAVLYTNFGPEYANLWLEERGYPRVKHEAFRSGAGISQLRRFWLSKVEGTGEWVNDGSLTY